MTLNLTFGEAVTIVAGGISLLVGGLWALILFYFSRADRLEDRRIRAENEKLDAEEKVADDFRRSVNAAIEALKKTMKEFGDKLHEFGKQLAVTDIKLSHTDKCLDDVKDTVNQFFAHIKSQAKTIEEQKLPGHTRLKTGKKE
jgi:septal ring factor EnvC (AmiA/AmiB activator)